MRESERIYIARSYKIIILLALVMHITFAVLFGMLHINEMMLYNICASMFYTLLIWMVTHRYYRLIVALVHLEVCLFVVVSTLFLGWGYGFAFYLVAMTSLVYFNPFDHKSAIYFFPTIEIVIFFFLKFCMEVNLPYIQTPMHAQMLFEYLNAAGYFTIILVGVLVSGYALNSVRQERDRFVYDHLTGVYRREHFIQRVESTLKKHASKEYILFLTNIVGLKYFNEIFGEERGNEVLKAQASLLMELKNKCLWFGRVSGNEFAVFMEADKFNETDLLENALTLQKLFSNDLYQTHVHMGIYQVLKEEPVATMLDKAAMAIESLQGEYGTCYAYYTEHMLQKSLHEKRILSEFEEALEEGQFFFYLQPQVSGDGICLGAETLVRWNHPSKGIILPGAFISVLENTRLIWKLDLYIWEEAVKKLKEWIANGHTNLSISVNISPKDFYYLNIYEVFTSLVEKYEVPPRYLKLEITETAFFEDIQKQLTLIERLQEYGFAIEIDDFGSGFSSLNLLKDIKADILKIDMVFLSKTENVQRSWTILASILDLAKKIGMETIMEGVETQEQVTRLQQIGCNVFQGYFFSRPLPVETFESNYL